MLPTTKRGPVLAPLRRQLLTGSAIGLVLACAVGAPALAQQASGGATQLPPVTVQGTGPTPEQEETYKPEAMSSQKYSEPLRDTPQSIVVVPREVMEEQGVTSLRDALRYVPGVTALAGEGGVRGDQIRIRGFGSSTDIYQDGFRDIGQYFRESFYLEQIEVTKGPSSAYGGRGTTGGSVNLVTKTPRLDTFYNGDLSLGTNALIRGTADLNAPITGMGLEGAAIRLNAMGHDAEVAGRDVTETQRWGFAPSLALGLGTPTRFNLSYVHVDQDGIPDYGLPAVAGQPSPVRRSNFYGYRDFNTEQAQLDQITGGFERDINSNLTLSSKLRFSEVDFFQITSPPRSPNIAANTVNRNPNGRDEVTRLYANQTDLNYRFNTGSVTHALVTGLELSREEIDRRTLTFAGSIADNLFNPNPNTPFPGSYTRSAVTENTGDNIGIYVQDAVTLSPKWEAQGGLRFDRFEFESQPPAAAATTRRDTMPSYRAGLNYKPLHFGSVYVAYGSSFNPSAESVTLNNNLVNVEPEKTNNYEIGTKWDVLNERLALTAAIYRTEKTNARTPGLAGEPAMVLNGEQRAEGVELGFAGNITGKWKIFGGYVYTDGKIVKSNTAAEVGKQIAQTPEHSFTLWTTYDLPRNFEVGAGAQYLSDRFTNNTNTGIQEGYIVYDAMVGYKVTEAVTLRLNIYNLMDEFYIERAHSGGSHAIPGPSRYAVLTTSFQF